MAEQGEDQKEEAPRRTRVQPWWRWPVKIAAAVVAFGTLTSFTGFPGPGPIRRFPVGDLNELAAKINAQPAVWVSDCSSRHLLRPGAHVDFLRGRVILDGGVTELLTPGEQAMLDRPAFMPVAPDCV